MKHINDHLCQFDEGEDVLFRSMKIKEKQKNYPHLINATIGTLYNEDKSPSILKVVKETMQTLNDNENFLYSSTQGPVGFDTALIRYLFGQYEQDIRKKKYIGVIPTPGATGAINQSLFMTLNEKDTVIIPSICWNVYFNMCQSMNFNYVVYDYIKDNHFDFEGFKNCVEEISQKQKHIVTILNDPCNNPTGYSLTFEEFSRLIAYLNSREDLTFTLIYDVAYYEYSIEDSRKKFAMLKELNSHVMTILAWSASKAFTMYGLRLGAMVIIDSDSKQTLEFTDLSRMIARTKWSCVSSSALYTVNKILSDEKRKQCFFEELGQFNNMLLKRIRLFEKQANDIGLNMIPYHGGFFVAVFCQNVLRVVEELEKEDIYVIPNNKVIRIAICGITLQQCDGLAKKIYQCIERVDHMNKL